MIQSIDRAARSAVVAAGRPPPRHHRARRGPRAAAVHGARHRQVAAGARARREGARHAAATCSARRCSSSPTSTSTPSTCAPGRCAGPRELARRTGLATRLGAELFDEVIIIHHNRRPDGTRADARDRASRSRRTPPRSARCCSPTTRRRRSDPRERRCAASPATTITDPADLAVQLAQIVERGIAHEEDEAVLGESSIAAPVADRSGAGHRRGRRRAARRASGRPTTTCSTTCARPRATSRASSARSLAAGRRSPPDRRMTPR